MWPADEILDGLFLGGAANADDRSFISDKKITHVLSVQLGYIPRNKDLFEWLNIPVLDWDSENLTAHFEKCITFIQNGLKSGRVLVHCGVGISRSPTIVIAYLMKTRNLTYLEARKIVETRRPGIEPNDGFVQQLQDFEANLQNQ